MLNPDDFKRAIQAIDALGATPAVLVKVAELLDQHRQDLAGFLNRDGGGDKVVDYLKAVGLQSSAEQARVLQELRELIQNIEHVKKIVAMQQSYAKVCGVIEMNSVQALMEDALRLQDGAFARHHIRVIREFEAIPEVAFDRHKVLQIAINLIGNAKHALSQSSAAERCLTLGLHRLPADRIQITVADNGIGIAPENQARIFSHGFTTRRDGHGFGLHGSALAAREMGGSLSVHSDGLGKGAAFVLEIPIQNQRLSDSK